MPAPVSPAISPHQLALMTTRFKKIIVEVGGEIRPMYPYVANVDPELINANPFLIKQYSGLGTMPTKPEGTQFKMDNIIEGGQVQVFTYPWGKGFEYTYEAMLFDLYRLYDDIASDLVRAAAHRKEIIFWNLFNDAFLGATYVGFDGLPLCSLVHPYLDPGLGTQANMSATDISLSIAGLQVMEMHSNLLEDERGLPDERRRFRVVLIHPSKIPTARIVLGSIYNPLDSSNAINPIIDSNYKYLPCRYLTSTTAWFGLTEQGLHGLNMRFASHELPGTYTDPRNMSMFSTLYMNLAVWFDIWRGVWGSRGAGA